MSKPWRHFRKKGRGSSMIVRACCVLLVLELAVLWKQWQIPLVSVTEHEREWYSLFSGSEKGILEEFWGLRIRMEDGVIELYRKEEIKNTH